MGERMMLFASVVQPRLGKTLGNEYSSFSKDHTVYQITNAGDGRFLIAGSGNGEVSVPDAVILPMRLTPRSTLDLKRLVLYAAQKKASPFDELDQDFELWQSAPLPENQWMYDILWQVHTKKILNLEGRGLFKMSRPPYSLEMASNIYDCYEAFAKHLKALELDCRHHRTEMAASIKDRIEELRSWAPQSDGLRKLIQIFGPELHRLKKDPKVIDGDIRKFRRRLLQLKQSTRYGSADIFVMNVDGTNLKRLTFDPHSAGFPSFGAANRGPKPKAGVIAGPFS
ncbi:MAG: TolB family protein [Fimbriimonadales bacterium]